MEKSSNEKTNNEKPKKEKRIEMVLASVLFILGFAAPPQQAGIRLPAGVKGVSFGQAQRYNGPGKEMCAIVRPLASPPVFEGGVREISYAVELEPQAVKSASARVVAPAGQELRAAGCNVFTPIKGGFSQTQVGSTLSRTDNALLLPGRYTLHIVVDGQTAEIPFVIGR
jgi:hypothetical protein